MFETIPDVVNVPLPLIRVELPLVSVADTSLPVFELPDSEDVLFPPEIGMLVPVPAPAVPVTDPERVPEPADMEEFQPPNVDESPRGGLLRPEPAESLILSVTERDVSVVDSEPDADGSLGPGLPALGAPVSVDDSPDVPELGSRVVAVGSPMVQLPEPVDSRVVAVGSPIVQLPEPVDANVVSVGSPTVKLPEPVDSKVVAVGSPTVPFPEPIDPIEPVIVVEAGSDPDGSPGTGLLIGDPLVSVSVVPPVSVDSNAEVPEPRLAVTVQFPLPVLVTVALLDVTMHSH